MVFSLLNKQPFKILTVLRRRSLIETYCYIWTAWFINF